MDNPMSSNSKDLNLHCAVQLVLCRWEIWPKPFNCFPRQQLQEESGYRNLCNAVMLNADNYTRWMVLNGIAQEC